MGNSPSERQRARLFYQTISACQFVPTFMHRAKCPKIVKEERSLLLGSVLKPQARIGIGVFQR
jgi:hypothetical protein